MSCLPETTYAIYVDDELSPEETRLVEAHLVGCRKCRGTVASLRDEASLLSDALRERPDVAPAVQEAATPEPGLALGLPVAVAGVATVLAVATYLAETRFWGGLDLLDPLNLLKGAYEMAFDVVFLARDQVPGLLELALSLGAVAGISALGSFGLGMLYRRVAGASLAIAAALMVAGADPASAVDMRLHEDTIRVSADETLEESLVATGESVEIDGTVEGDLIAWARRVTVRGRIEGDVYAFTRHLEITGEVKGAVHAVSHRSRIGGEIGEKLYNAGEELSLASGSKIGRDAAHFGERAVLEGDVGRDVLFAGAELDVRGKVGRRLQVIHADRVTLHDGARVGGDVDAVLHRDEIEILPGAVVAGEVRTRPARSHRGHYLARYAHPQFYLWVLVQIAAAFLFGLLVHGVAPRVFPTKLPDTRGFFRAMGIGFLIAIAAPFAIALCGLTVVGIPAALVGLFAFATALYGASVAVGALVGRTLVSGDSFGIPLLAGVAAVTVAIHLPFLGIPLALVTILTGLGLLYQHLWELRAAG